MGFGFFAAETFLVLPAGSGGSFGVFGGPRAAVAVRLDLGEGGVAQSVSRSTGQRPEEVAAGAAAQSVTGRFTHPQEVADLVVLLASDRTSNVTGAINSTETTLGSRAEAAAITSIRRIMMRKGEPLARLAAQIAAYSKTPVCRRMLTIIIMPNIKKMTSQSTPVSAE